MTEILIVGTASKDSGGIAQYINEQVKHLGANIVVHDIAPPDGSGVRWLLAAVITAISDALEYPKYNPPDIVHVHTSHKLSFLRASFYILFTKYVWPCPVVVHIHGSSFDQFINTDYRLLAWYQSLVLGASCRVIVLSSYWEDILATRVASSKIRSIPNAIEASEYKPTLDRKEPHIVFISNLVERKGVNEFIEVVQQLERTELPAFEVTIAGKGPLSDEVTAISTELDHVEYRGFVSEEEKQVIFNEGNIFVLPSYAEGLPIAILEAMAGGNAVISTNVGSIPEVIENENGIIVPPEEISPLRSALEELISDPDRVQKMGKRNREMAKTRYSWESVTNELNEVYQECGAALK